MNRHPITAKEFENLMSYMDYAAKLRAMTPRDLVFEVLGTRAADYQVVNELMNRVLPDWEKQFTEAELESAHEPRERHRPNPLF